MYFLWDLVIGAIGFHPPRLTQSEQTDSNGKLAVLTFQ